MARNWLKQRREHLRITQDELAARLQVAGFEVTRSTISHWEVGRNSPPLENPDFRRALAKVLKLTVPTLLKLEGFEATVEYSHNAQHAAEIIDQLPEDKQRLALGILEQFLSEIG